MKAKSFINSSHLIATPSLDYIDRGRLLLVSGKWLKGKQFYVWINYQNCCPGLSTDKVISPAQHFGQI